MQPGVGVEDGRHRARGAPLRDLAGEPGNSRQPRRGGEPDGEGAETPAGAGNWHR